MTSHSDQVADSEQRASDARRDLVASVADLDLTEEEMRTLEWLTRWETQTMANVTAIIRKARKAGVW